MRHVLNVEWGIGSSRRVTVCRRGLAVVVALGVPACLWLTVGRNRAGKAPRVPGAVRAPSQRSENSERHDQSKPASPHGANGQVAHTRNSVSPTVTAKRAAMHAVNLARAAAEGRGRVREASP